MGPYHTLYPSIKEMAITFTEHIYVSNALKNSEQNFCLILWWTFHNVPNPYCLVIHFEYPLLQIRVSDPGGVRPDPNTTGKKNKPDLYAAPTMIFFPIEYWYVVSLRKSFKKICSIYDWKQNKKSSQLLPPSLQPNFVPKKWAKVREQKPKRAVSPPWMPLVSECLLHLPPLKGQCRYFEHGLQW